MSPAIQSPAIIITHTHAVHLRRCLLPNTGFPSLLRRASCRCYSLNILCPAAPSLVTAQSASSSARALLDLTSRRAHALIPHHRKTHRRLRHLSTPSIFQSRRVSTQPVLPLATICSPRPVPSHLLSPAPSPKAPLHRCIAPMKVYCPQSYCSLSCYERKKKNEAS